MAVPPEIRRGLNYTDERENVATPEGVTVSHLCDGPLNIKGYHVK